MTTCPSSPRRSFTRAAYRCQCLERTLQDETFPVKVVAFDFDETLTLITYLIEDGDSEEVQKQIVKTNFQTPWVKGSRIEHLQSMLKALAISKSGKRRALAVLTKNYAGAKAVHNLLHVSGLASCFDAIWALPTGGLYRCKDEWHEMCTPNVCHKADLLALVAESPHEFFPQLGSDAFEDMGPLKMEGIVLVDDQRANFQSPSGNQVLRFCKVARYDGYYRNLGYVKNMGGIGAHCFEDYETLKMFVEEPSTYKETLHLHCVERHFERSSEQHPVELIIFDFDETLTLATFMPSDPTFEEISWDLPSLEGSDWTAEDLLTYNFESPFCSGSRLQALKAMLEDLSKRYVLAILSRNDRGAVAVLNLLRLAQLADFFAAIWTMPFRQQVSCGAWKADAAWHVFEAPLLEVPDEKTEILYHIVENSGKWFPQMEDPDPATGEESFVDLEGGGTADPRNDLPDVRSEMRQLLVEAAGNGQLREALKDFDDESGRKAEAVREKAGDLLMAATENGDFEKILKDLQSSDAAKKKNVDEIRTKAAQLLVSSADNGDLRKALAEIRTMPAQPSPRQETRRKAAELLVEAADNGQLKKALEEIKGSPSGPNLQKLQMKVGDVLMAAIENGDLEKAIKEVSENPPADPAAGAS